MENEFKKELEHLINRHSLENASDTPDFILANYIQDCLYAFETATLARDKWYNFKTLTRGNEHERHNLQ